VRGGQIRPHRPRLAESLSTCPPFSPFPLAHSFLPGPPVINTYKARDAGPDGLLIAAVNTWACDRDPFLRGGGFSKAVHAENLLQTRSRQGMQQAGDHAPKQEIMLLCSEQKGILLPAVTFLADLRYLGPFLTQFLSGTRVSCSRGLVHGSKEG
jgi:hypothetical protein